MLEGVTYCGIFLAVLGGDARLEAERLVKRLLHLGRRAANEYLRIYYFLWSPS